MPAMIFLKQEGMGRVFQLSNMVNKIAYHAENLAETRQIAEAAYHRVMSEHRYVDRAGKLLRFCLYWKQKKRLIPVPTGI